MNRFSQTVVHHVLAQHLGVDVRAIDRGQRLRDDLALDDFSLALVAIRIEEVVPGRRYFPLDMLDRVKTVRELSALTEAWLDDDAVEEGERTTLPSEAPLWFVPLEDAANECAPASGDRASRA